MTQINLSAAATWPGIDNEMDRNEMNNTKRKALYYLGRSLRAVSLSIVGIECKGFCRR